MPRRPLLSPLLGVGAWILLALPLFSSEKWLTIGDSLTKEYALEFPILHPGNPAAWNERNWIELLSEHRPTSVDIGPLAFWPDSRLTGHETNFAFPGSTSSEWAEILTSTFLSAPENVLLRISLDAYLIEEAERVVIFLGGNDLKNEYGTYYDGANPAPFIARLVGNLRTVVEYVQARNATLPIVLVAMPDVSVTPTVQASKPDPDKRLRNTAMTAEINRGLRALAAEKDVGFADISSLTATLQGPEAFVIGGVRFWKTIDPLPLSNRSQYLFSPDGFHPNTAAQLLFANAIVDAFARHYPHLEAVPPFTTTEMLTILGIEPDQPFADWLAAYGIDPLQDNEDGDEHALLAEFALKLDPRKADGQRSLTGGWDGNRLSLDYELRLADSVHVNVVPESSGDLVQWEPLPATQVVSQGRQRFRAWVEPETDPLFLRLTFSRP